MVDGEPQACVGFAPHDGERCFFPTLISQFCKELVHDFRVLVTCLQIVHMEEHTQLVSIHLFIEPTGFAWIRSKSPVQQVLSQLEVTDAPTLETPTQGLGTLAAKDRLPFLAFDAGFSFWGH